MSPNEFQLRAALHDGEGEVPKANLAIADALRIRRERRRLITSVASAAAVVAVIALGGTLVARNDGMGTADSGGGAMATEPNQLGALPPGQMTHGGNPAPGGGAYDAPSAAASSVHADASTARAAEKAYDVECPARLPRQTLPGGGGTDQFGANGPLFDAPVVAMKICVYATEGNSSVKLAAAAAGQLAASLEAAPVTGDPMQCLTIGPKYAIYAVGSSGAVMPVVTAEAGCHAYRVTNGTAVRVVPFEQFDAVHPAYTAPPPNQGSPPK